MNNRENRTWLRYGLFPYTLQSKRSFPSHSTPGARRIYWSISSSCQQGTGTLCVLCILIPALGNMTLLSSMANSVIASPKCLFSFSHFFLVQTEQSSLLTVNVFLQTQSSLSAGLCSFSLELVFHLITAHSLDLWARNYFFSALGEKK